MAIIKILTNTANQFSLKTIHAVKRSENSKYVKRLNMQYNLKAKGGMHTFEQYRH